MSDPPLTAEPSDLDETAGDLEADDELDDEDDEAFDDEAFDDEDDEDDDGGPDGNRVVGGLARTVLDYLARAIVDDPESVVVEIEEGRRGLTLRLHVAPGDMGRIIGRRGRVAQAIRTVTRAAGAREGVDVNVDIAD